MKAVIRAGGFGTRLSEETHLKPKPMVEIGGKPILWHIMKLYSHYDINEFIICCGYKGYMIKEYFANYFTHTSDVTYDLTNNEILIHKKRAESWKVTLVDTGESSMTGGRLKRVAQHLKDDESFCFTYGDGVADIDISKLIEFHNSHGKLATLTATLAPGRFGALEFSGDQVLSFREKPKLASKYLKMNTSSDAYYKFDKLISSLFSWNVVYHPKSKLQKVGPGSIYFVVEKSA